MRLPKKIPKKFWSYFWDVDVKKLDPSKKPYFVIQRMLDWDDFSASKWVINNFLRRQIDFALTNLRGWSKKSAIFWGTYFKIPYEELMCNRKGFPNPPHRFWNY